MKNMATRENQNETLARKLLEVGEALRIPGPFFPMRKLKWAR